MINYCFKSIYEAICCGSMTPVPCSPESLVVMENDPENCTFSWNLTMHAHGYSSFIKRNDGGEEAYNTTGNSWHFHCECGYTYRASVFAYNLAGLSDPGPEVNYTIRGFPQASNVSPLEC